jgi:hypothetical protein
MYAIIYPCNRQKISFPLPATTLSGSFQQGLSVLGGALDLFQLGLTTDKCYSLEIMPTIKRAEKFMDRQGAAILGLAISSMAIIAITMYLVADPTLQKVLGATWCYLVCRYWHSACGRSVAYGAGVQMSRLRGFSRTAIGYRWKIRYSAASTLCKVRRALAGWYGTRLGVPNYAV